jgi:glycosyltransferase involved in cell wall biosynthesis
LAALVEVRGIDVVHVHGYRATVTAAVAGSRLVGRVVKTVHGLPEPGGGPIGRTKSGLNHALDTWATRRLRASVCYVTAEIMRRFDRAHQGLPRRVIHNGIDPIEREGRPRPPALEPGFFHAGIVGRVSEVKGISYALQAMASPRVPAHVRLNIIGSGPLEERLQKEAEGLGITDRVRFHGFQRNVLDWLAHLDVLLMPSLHEGLPYTLLEAMSLGVPIVASRVGGLAEVLLDGETGLLLNPGEFSSMAHLLVHLAADPESRRRLASTAARAQRSTYALLRMAHDYATVYMTMRG